MPDQAASDVRSRTPRELNERIDREIRDQVYYHATRPVDFISHRILELESEWDVERLLKTSVAGLGLFGAGALLAVRRSWLAIPLLAVSLLAGSSDDALQPLLVALRQIGVRTRGEIDFERTALRALRGDFGDLAPGGSSQSRGEAALRLAGERVGRM